LRMSVGGEGGRKKNSLYEIVVGGKGRRKTGMGSAEKGIVTAKRGKQRLFCHPRRTKNFRRYSLKRREKEGTDHYPCASKGKSCCVGGDKNQVENRAH